jgi:phospholipid/cholesterol/gamma-HCH transport system permease protein
MPEAACRLICKDAGQVLHLTGDWTLEHLPRLDRSLKALRLDSLQPLVVDGSGLTALDSAGANRLVSHLHCCYIPFPHVDAQGFAPRWQALITLVAGRWCASRKPPPPQTSLLEWLGRRGMKQLHAFVDNLSFLGRTGQALGQLLPRPRLFRPREWVAQMDMVGLRAIPIVLFMNYLIGLVFAYLLGIQVQKFGANILVADGVGLAMTRELAPIITAVLVAGRSGAAFTAQLGAMKVSQEIDAISMLGLSPWQVLVLPRLLAIVIMLPLLTLLGDIAGIYGAGLVASLHLDIPLAGFLARVQDTLPLHTALFGLYKTPVFAAAIALIACHNGFAVDRDARSVGLYTTATVVRSIVAVLIIDASFAVLWPDIL